MSSLGVRGRERTLLAVAEALAVDGSTVDLLVPRPGDELRKSLPDGVTLVDLERWWMRIPGLRMRNKGMIFSSPPALIAYLRKRHPDVLLTASIPPSLAALFARKFAGGTTRMVLRQSNVVHVAKSARWGNVKRRPRDAWIPRLFSGADAVIAVSQGVADNLCELVGLPRSRVHVVPNRNVPVDIDVRIAEPVEHPWFVMPEDPGARVARKGGGSTVPVVLAVGRFVEKKDYPTLLRAFRKVRDQIEARLAILGRDGETRQTVESLIAELNLAGDVEILGFQTNPFRYMARADLFVLSSISEGMPNALVEALACGCPAVSTDCPSGPSEILAEGKYGALVPVGDHGALAAAMIETLRNPPDRERIRERGREFSVQRAVTAYVEILLRVAAQPAAGA